MALKDSEHRTNLLEVLLFHAHGLLVEAKGAITLPEHLVILIEDLVYDIEQEIG